MFNEKPIVRSLALAFGGLGCVLASSVLAQEKPQVGETVIITGSRIAAPGAASPSPLQVIGSEDIAAAGVTNVQDVLLKNPTFGVPGISRTNSNFATSSAGVSTIDLRDLDESRTLVLVNGRRFVAGVPGESAVDLNAIPTQFIERIELLTGGASSVYGSDAVAGVVNIIYRRNFEGIAFDAQTGRSEHGDDKRKQVSLTLGSTAAGGKGNVMGHVGYSKQGAVLSRDRDISAVDQASRGVFVTGDPNDIFVVQRPFFSSFAPQGRFFVGNTSRTFDAQGNLIPFSTNGPAGDGVGATGFNRSEFRTIAVPTERYLFAGTGEYEFAPNHSVFLEGTYASTQTKSELEPFPMDSADGTTGIYPATGNGPAEFLVNGVLRPNPLIPAALLALMTDTDGDGRRDYSFTRRLSEFGNRGNVADRDTFRLVTGVKGEAFKWNYEVFGGYGASKEAQVSSGQVNVLNFRNALEAVPDVNDIDGDGDTAEAICLDANARAQGCVPINVFGFNTVSPEALRYVTAPTLLATFTSQKLAGVTVTGEPLNLPAGPLGVAVGAEYRDEYSRSEFDPLAQAGLNAGNKIPRTEGGFDVKELFAELRVPVLKDVPFVKSLNFTGAVRGGDYSTVGNTFSWNAGVEWSPIADLKIRATRALSTRAPNINELFQPPSQDFPTGLSDPCVGVTATSTGARDAACRAAPGVNANIAANGSFVLNQADLQGVSGFDRGNPNVSEEEGHSWTLGLVVTPRSIPALRNVTLTIDYFDIKIDDAIVQTPRQFILDQCYGGDASFCQFITRRPGAVGANSAGSLQFIDSAVTNSGDLVTKGIDLTLGYGDTVGPGRLDARLSWTYLITGYITPLPGSEKDHFKGELPGDGGFGTPKNKGYLTLGYKWNNFGISTQTTYIGKMALDDQFLSSNFGLSRGSITVSEKVYNDLQLTYSPAKKVNVYFGIDNVFDVKPAPVISGLPGDITGTETAADIYDAIGRRYYLGFRMRL